MAARAHGVALTVGAVALACAGVGGCAALLGVDDFRDAASGGAGAGGSGAAGGSAGSGAGMGNEDCTDRVDNNGDSYADCEDPQCQGTHECAASPLTEWAGVGWIYVGTSPPECPEAVSLELFDEQQLVAEDATCTCQCSEPVDATCTAGFRCSYDCHSTVHSNTSAVSECQLWDAPHGNSECWAHSPGATSSECNPEAAVDVPTLSWPVAGLACLRPLNLAGHCAGQGEICIARPPAGAVGPCLAAEGDVECPPSYPDKTVHRDGTYDDQRSCDATACTCDTPVGTTCSCTSTPCGVELFNTTDCSAQSAGVAPFGGGCAGLDSAGPHGIQVVGAELDQLGSCTSHGSAPATGQVLPQGQITLCCFAGG